MAVLNSKQKEAITAAIHGDNLLITGSAGTGKTYVLQHIIKRLIGLGCEVIVCAPTGIAAIQAGGATIHRTFRAGWNPYLDGDKSKLLDTIVAADTIVIDEISMCRFDLCEYVIRCIRRAEQASKKAKQVIMCGDFYQLSPVLKAEAEYILMQGWPDINIGGGYAFRAPSFNSLGLKITELTEVMRQADREFVDVLNKIRKGDRSAIDWINAHCAHTEQNGIWLYATRKEAKKKNQIELDKLLYNHNVAQYRYRGVNISYKDDMPTELDLLLCDGARVMTLVNNLDEGYRNGSLGTITHLYRNGVQVLLDSGKIVNVEWYKWIAYDYVAVDDGHGKKRTEKIEVGKFIQIPVKLAYAVTIHKSQGQTYDAVNLDPSNCFAPGQLYVALSRVRDIKSLYLTQPLRPGDLQVSTEVMEFYGDYHVSSINSNNIAQSQPVTYLDNNMPTHTFTCPIV